MANCRKCGARIDAGARFCPVCGVPVEQGQPRIRKYAGLKVLEVFLLLFMLFFLIGLIYITVSYFVYESYTGHYYHGYTDYLGMIGGSTLESYHNSLRIAMWFFGIPSLMFLIPYLIVRIVRKNKIRRQKQALGLL